MTDHSPRGAAAWRSRLAIAARRPWLVGARSMPAGAPAAESRFDRGDLGGEQRISRNAARDAAHAVQHGGMVAAAELAADLGKAVCRQPTAEEPGDMARPHQTAGAAWRHDGGQRGGLETGHR